LKGQSGTVVFTPAIPPVAAVPAKLVANAGTGVTAISCTIVGNAVPATSLSITCLVGSTNIPAYTIPLTTGISYTFQFNYDVNAITFICQKPASGPITVSGTANSSPATNATF
jgi:hypothetical protein